MLVIGKFKNPSAFENRKIENIGPKYVANSKFWKAPDIFTGWSSELNKQMIGSGRKIALLLDNAPVHPIDTEFSNIGPFYFPPNTTSVLQSCDHGIIKSFKLNYRNFLVIRLFFSWMTQKKFRLTYGDIIKKI